MTRFGNQDDKIDAPTVVFPTKIRGLGSRGHPNRKPASFLGLLNDRSDSLPKLLIQWAHSYSADQKFPRRVPKHEFWGIGQATACIATNCSSEASNMEAVEVMSIAAAIRK